MSGLEQDWKARALDDFFDWLAAAPETLDNAIEGAPDPADEENGHDLYSLYAEFTVLRQEVRIQNREQSKAARELAKAAEFYATAADQIRRREQELTAFERQVTRATENRCLKTFLEVRDALVRGRDATAQLPALPTFFRKPRRQVAGLIEGYDLALRRFDRVLSGFGVHANETLGKPFDPRLMHATETRAVAGAVEGEVVTEFLSGFMRDGEVLRLADVAVNRSGPEGI